MYVVYTYIIIIYNFFTIEKPLNAEAYTGGWNLTNGSSSIMIAIGTNSYSSSIKLITHTNVTSVSVTLSWARKSVNLFFFCASKIVWKFVVVLIGICVFTDIALYFVNNWYSSEYNNQVLPSKRVIFAYG